jgi:hypothetical protein
MIYYVDAVHAFTGNFAGNDTQGRGYNEKHKRSWEHMKLFLKSEILN